MATLDELAVDIREVNKANGWNLVKPTDWNDPYKIPAVLALVHSEVSEALEGFRKNDGANFLEELADIQIRLLDLAGGLTAQFEQEVRQKIEKNRQRAHKHGGKRI